MPYPAWPHRIYVDYGPWVMYGFESWTKRKKLSTRELILLVLEKTLESSLDCKEIKPVNPKGNQSWILIGRTNAEVEAPILWPPDAKSWLIEKTLIWERLKAGGEGDNRGWDGWMASPTWWTWVWASSGSRWWTGKPSVLQSMGLQRVRHDWAAKLNWWTWHSRFLCNVVLYHIGLHFHHQTHPQLSIISTWPSLIILSEAISALP